MDFKEKYLEKLKLLQKLKKGEVDTDTVINSCRGEQVLQVPQEGHVKVKSPSEKARVTLPSFEVKVLPLTEDRVTLASSSEVGSAEVENQIQLALPSEPEVEVTVPSFEDEIIRNPYEVVLPSSVSPVSVPLDTTTNQFQQLKVDEDNMNLDMTMKWCEQVQPDPKVVTTSNEPPMQYSIPMLSYVGQKLISKDQTTDIDEVDRLPRGRSIGAGSSHSSDTDNSRRQHGSISTGHRGRPYRDISPHQAAKERAQEERRTTYDPEYLLQAIEVRNQMAKEMKSQPEDDDFFGDLNGPTELVDEYYIPN